MPLIMPQHTGDPPTPHAKNHRPKCAKVEKPWSKQIHQSTHHFAASNLQPDKLQHPRNRLDPWLLLLFTRVHGRVCVYTCTHVYAHTHTGSNPMGQQQRKLIYKIVGCPPKAQRMRGQEAFILVWARFPIAVCLGHVTPPL